MELLGSRQRFDKLHGSKNEVFPGNLGKLACVQFSKCRPHSLGMGGLPKTECIHGYFQRGYTVDLWIRKNFENIPVGPFVQLAPVESKTSNPPMVEANKDTPAPAPADAEKPGKLLSQQE